MIITIKMKKKIMRKRNKEDIKKHMKYKIAITTTIPKVI